MKLPTLVALLLAAPAALAQTIQVDAKLPVYKPIQGVSGSIKSVGSDTLNNLMTLWAEDFKKHYPAVAVEVEGKGSGTAPPALINGSSTFGPMSRPMKQKEIDDFEKAFGYPPTAVPVAVDTLAIYVHKDNPLTQLSLGEVDALFSKSRKAGWAKDLTTWGDLGLTGEWADKPIALYGRNSASGTYGFFKEHALANGDFKDTVKEQPGSSAVVQGVASDKYAIGYSGIGYRTADVKVLKLAKDAKSEAFEVSQANAYAGQYPMTRMLYVYVNKKPGAELDPLRREFLRYVLSKPGQEATVKDGFYPLTPRLVDQGLKAIGLEALPVEAGAKR
ncbi:MAG: PstS family phosphate ABC transporter substrate-binding protein [Planctomycetes bacterium]|nr:PstS family phosphate ABC transporter substrate-binding protein [Planctomycetota bacterium]